MPNTEWDYSHPIYDPRKSGQTTSGPRSKVIVLSGPTAVGKTALSLYLAKRLGGQIVSADSMQVYQGMDLGTAKASLDERRQIPHYLIDIRKLTESFDAASYFEEAKKAINFIIAQNKVPIVVGGTGFYIDTLINGPPVGPPSDPKVRTQLEEQIKHFGVEPLFDRLSKLDPEYAKTITTRDRRKIVRALEIITLSQKKVTDFDPAIHSKGLDVDFRAWFLSMPKPTLDERINNRCDLMLATGLIDEVEELQSKGLLENESARQAIGYKQAIIYLQSDKSQEDYAQFVKDFKAASRRYAKKQFTWFRKREQFKWIDLDQYTLEQAGQIICQDYERE